MKVKEETTYQDIMCLFGRYLLKRLGLVIYGWLYTEAVIFLKYNYFKDWALGN